MEDHPYYTYRTFTLHLIYGFQLALLISLALSHINSTWPRSLPKPNPRAPASDQDHAPILLNDNYDALEIPERQSSLSGSRGTIVRIAIVNANGDGKEREGESLVEYSASLENLRGKGEFCALAFLTRVFTGSGEE